MNKQIKRWEISDVCYKHRDRNGEWMLAEEGVKLQEKIQKLTLAVSFLILIAVVFAISLIEARAAILSTIIVLVLMIIFYVYKFFFENIDFRFPNGHKDGFVLGCMRLFEI